MLSQLSSKVWPFPGPGWVSVARAGMGEASTGPGGLYTCMGQPWAVRRTIKGPQS